MEENEDAFLVVAESYARYKAAAYYDDELLVRTHITEMRKRSLRFGYEIVRAADGQIIAEGETGHVVTDANPRVRSCLRRKDRSSCQLPVASGQFVTRLARTLSSDNKNRREQIGCNFSPQSSTWSHHCIEVCP